MKEKRVGSGRHFEEGKVANICFMDEHEVITHVLTLHKLLGLRFLGWCAVSTGVDAQFHACSMDVLKILRRLLSVAHSNLHGFLWI